MLFFNIRDWRTVAGRTFLGAVLTVTLTSCDAAIGPSDSESAAAASITSNTAPSFGEWQVDRSTDPLSDQVKVGIALPAKEGEAIFGLFCSDGGHGVVAIWQNYLSGEKIGDQKYQPIIYRIGDAQPVSDLWEILADDNTTENTSPHEFIREALSSNRLVLQTQPYKEMPKTAVFDTTGLMEVLKANSPECDWFLNGDAKPVGTTSK